MNLSELLQAQPQLMNEFKSSIIDAHKAGEKARVDEAVKAALDEQAKKGAPAATLAQLRAAVPANMDGRDALILELLEKGATEAQANQAVAAKLAAQNAELQKQLAGKASKAAPAAIADVAAGVPRLAITRASIANAATYEEAVSIETDNVLARDPKLTDMQARAKARTRVSQERRDLLDAHNQELEKSARERVTTKRKAV